MRCVTQRIVGLRAEKLVPMWCLFDFYRKTYQWLRAESTARRKKMAFSESQNGLHETVCSRTVKGMHHKNWCIGVLYKSRPLVCINILSMAILKKTFHTARNLKLKLKLEYLCENEIIYETILGCFRQEPRWVRFKKYKMTTHLVALPL